MKLIFILLFFGFQAFRAIMKSAKEKAEKQARLAQGGNPNRKQRVQGEIEAFLNEVGGGQRSDGDVGSQPGGQGRRQQTRENREQDARDRQEQLRQEQIQQRREKKRQQRQAQTAAATAPRRQVGSGVSEHVDEYINRHVSEHIDHDIEEYVESTIVDSVDGHLGNRDLEMGGTTSVSHRSSPAAKAVLKLMKDPVGVRNAILVNEILAPPRALRK